MDSSSYLKTIRERVARKRRFRRRRRFIALLFVIAVIAALKYGSQVPGAMGAGENLPRLSEASSTSFSYDDDYAADDSMVSSGSVSRSGSNFNRNRESNLAAIKNELANYISKFSGKYGIYYLNLANGDEFGINDTEEYIAASTVKVPINLYLFKKIEIGQVNPEETVTYLKEDYEGGTGNIQYQKVGTRYKIRELSRLSIQVSDNVATNMLLRLLGRENVKDYMRALGGKVVDDEKNISCPRDMALYLKEVYAFYKSNKTLGGELMGYLQNTVFNDRIPKLLPKDVKVAHKTGNQVRAVHDVGIVFAKEPYIICVMSKDVDEEESYNVIANISRKIYDFAVKKAAG